MRKYISLLLGVFFIAAAVPKIHAAVTVDFFYDSLDPYGDWMDVADYGYCWHPRDVDADWSPYSVGHWAYTDAGWTWLSDEPFGWAVYHYGRWIRIEGTGWVWVPGTEWAPAWVAWRHSPKYVGWAPLPPEAEFRAEVGIGDWADSYYDIGPGSYSFIEVRNFGAPRMRDVLIRREENITVISETTNITKITYVNNVVFDDGPQFDVISRGSSQPIRRFRLQRDVGFEGDPRSLPAARFQTQVEGDSIRIIAPVFEARAASAPRKLAPRIDNAEVNRGWKDAGPPAEVQKLQAKIKSEAKPPAQLPAQPKFEKITANPASTGTGGPAPASTGTSRPAAGGATATGTSPAPAGASPMPSPSSAASPATSATTPAASPSPATGKQKGRKPAPSPGSAGVTPEPGTTPHTSATPRQRKMTPTPNEGAASATPRERKVTPPETGTAVTPQEPKATPTPRERGNTMQEGATPKPARTPETNIKPEKTPSSSAATPAAAATPPPKRRTAEPAAGTPEVTKPKTQTPTPAPLTTGGAEKEKPKKETTPQPPP